MHVSPRVGGAAAPVAELGEPARRSSVNSMRNAVALLEDAGAGELERGEGGRIRAAPRVDGLVGVGDDDCRFGLSAPANGERELETAEVLALVEHQHARRGGMHRRLDQAALDEVGEVDALGALLEVGPGGEVVALLLSP
jgi:hypothetical protein